MSVKGLWKPGSCFLVTETLITLDFLNIKYTISFEVYYYLYIHIDM